MRIGHCWVEGKGGRELRVTVTGEVWFGAQVGMCCAWPARPSSLTLNFAFDYITGAGVRRKVVKYGDDQSFLA